MKHNFTLAHYRDILSKALDHDYQILSCYEYLRARELPRLGPRVLVLRHDVDDAPQRAEAMAAIEADLGVRTSYFFRVFSNRYNALSYNTLLLIRGLDQRGFEVGYHAEPSDVAVACQMPEFEAYWIGKKCLEAALGHPILGAASHREPTGINNLDFLGRYSPEDLGVAYEAYDTSNLNLFRESEYVTDGYEWYWRHYVGGALTTDQSCLCSSLDAELPLVYSLIHPNSWYDTHYHLDRALW